MQKYYPLDNRLKEFRMSLGLRQEDVAKQLGMDCTDRLSHWEKGKAMPNMVNLFKLCNIYDKTPQDIYVNVWNLITNHAK